MAAAKGVSLNHIALGTSDIKRLAKFYNEILGFEVTKTLQFGRIEVMWMTLAPSLWLHLIQKDPDEPDPPEGPWSSTVPKINDTKKIRSGHHIAFAVSNYDSLVQILKEKGIEVFEQTQNEGKIRQAFFSDPDGNGLEVGSYEASEL